MLSRFRTCARLAVVAALVAAVTVAIPPSSTHDGWRRIVSPTFRGHIGIVGAHSGRAVPI
jgi:hypothetical protein